jgi:hypothetical protein
LYAPLVLVNFFSPYNHTPVRYQIFQKTTTKNNY